MGVRSTWSDVASIRKPRAVLVTIRRWYANDLTTKLQEFIALGLALASAAVLIDIFLPFGGLWMAIRTVILIPLSSSIYVLGYMISLWLHDRRSLDDDWKPFRTRFSLMWRRRFGIIGAALIVVLVMSNGFSPFYTFASSVILSLGFGILAFIRPTKHEAMLSELKLPDPRDYNYQEQMKEVSNRQKEKAQQLARERKLRRTRILKGKSASEELEIEFENEDRELKK